MNAKRAKQAPVVPPPINDVVRTIVTRFAPIQIVLFGSWARGNPGPDSDLDLLVIMESPLPPNERAMAIDLALWPRRWPLDVLVYTPAEIAQMRQTFGSLIHTIDAEGRLLYERP